MPLPGREKARGRHGAAGASMPSVRAVTAIRPPFKRWYSLICRKTQVADMFRRSTCQRAIGLEPLDETADAIGNRGRRLEIDLARQVVDIGVGRQDVSRLHRQELALGLDADSVFKQTDDLEQFDRIVVADVVDAPGGGARSG